MYKQFRLYYLYTILPFATLLLAAIMYRQLIAHTIQSNPHPQINYLIFLIVLAAGMLAIYSVKRLMSEVQALSTFVSALNAGKPQAELQAMALASDAAIAYVLRMLAATAQRNMSHQEQVALENEVDKASKRLGSHSTLPSFLGGLLVGLGLLGTFIGLLATLDDIAILISSFSNLDMKTADPIAVFAQMVKRMEAPMHSMGVAFSASMYGLLGSMVISLMMVSVKKLQSELVSVLNSEVAQHIEHSLIRPRLIQTHTGSYQQPTIQGSSSEQPAADKSASSDAIPEVMHISIQEQPANLGLVGAPPDDHNAINELDGEELRVLKRIEIRLAESIKSQEKTLSAEMADFQKQRADMLRLIAENTEAANDFRNELQRVGRQLGGILGVMERSNEEVVSEIKELVIRLADDGAETHRLLNLQLIQKK